jgi:hypothetical protein
MKVLVLKAFVTTGGREKRLRTRLPSNLSEKIFDEISRRCDSGRRAGRIDRGSRYGMPCTLTVSLRRRQDLPKVSGHRIHSRNAIALWGNQRYPVPLEKETIRCATPLDDLDWSELLKTFAQIASGATTSPANLCRHSPLASGRASPN